MTRSTQISAARRGEISEQSAPNRGHFCCGCFIVPPKVLERFAQDVTLSQTERQSFANAVELEAAWRRGRNANVKVAQLAREHLAITARTGLAAGVPSVSVFDCRHGTSLPGTPVAKPQTSGDATAARVAGETLEVVNFYQTVFGRSSLDDAGMGLLSSIHYGVDYNNAFWNGAQMTYGDGDGAIFLDFTLSNDVIAHELTHGVTQFSAGFAYANESGGLNESMSDVFGSMFRQWRAGQSALTADWLIGKEIMGPKARQRGYSCLRDLSNPSGPHCLAAQPDHFSQYVPGMDPHDSSGIPNLAFYRTAMALGGNSWDQAGKVWYQALAGSAVSPNMKMKAFADRTRVLAQTMYAATPTVHGTIDQAWSSVGL